MNSLKQLLSQGDLRSIGQSNYVVSIIDNQHMFDELFQLLYDADRRIVMRAADALEKLSVTHPHYLSPHKKDMILCLSQAENKELKWHLALMISRLKLTDQEMELVWKQLSAWALNPSESNIVRVNSIQTLFEFSQQHSKLQNSFNRIISQLKYEAIPSIQARIKKMRLLDNENL